MDQNVSDLYTVTDGGLVRRSRMPAPHLTIDAHICTPALEVSVRTLTLEDPLDAMFRPSMCYLDQCLDERSALDRGTFVGNGGYMDFAPLGDSLLVPAGQTFHVRCGPIRRRVVCCMFEAEWLDGLRDWQWGAAELDMCRDLRLPAVRDTMLLLAREALEPGFGSECLAESLVHAMLVHVARRFRSFQTARKGAGAKLAPWQLRLIRERVEAASGPSPGITELAAACRISPRHLARVFKQSTGTTLGAFIADARIRQAKSLLSRRDVLIKAVAFECGFQSAAAFGAAFRKTTGRTPREYRVDAIGLRVGPSDSAVRVRSPSGDSLTG
ncbi:helix-turn-helix transcriptional regulator [Cupriavidus pinatubonensis]|uniref:HTH-type transcriptional activator RhaR n=1 Tax=Cupriavidus pinatubonensis TaxID=248026 RepID=A0ABM8WFD7_9BURK|nr:helix-turn-helix transcriptional regulator [Cupriavidus pinatubonensis]CAG9166048.1 HTH-type transcriptional activator RhaR [Cupriavidus pinatubonensis]